VSQIAEVVKVTGVCTCVHVLTLTLYAPRMSLSDASGVTPSTDRYPLSALFSPTDLHTGTLTAAAVGGCTTGTGVGKPGEGAGNEECACESATPLVKLCAAEWDAGSAAALEDSIMDVLRTEMEYQWL
jgi:hypothetical protein